MSHRKVIQKIIEFADPKNPRTGFLSNESIHSFVLDDKKWPSVEHYLQAKKFAETEFEETIRNAPTVYQVRKLTRAKTKTITDADGNITKMRVYGKKGLEYYVREDWEEIKPILMEEAIKAKFTQNPQLKNRLLDTHDAKLENPNDILVGPILERVRKSFSLSLNPLPKEQKRWNPDEVEDFSSPQLSPGDRRFVKNILALSSRIAKEEGQDFIYEGMVEDAIYNLTRKTEVVKYIQGIFDTSWTLIFSKLPNHEKIINEIHIMLTKINPQQSDNVSQSALIAAFLSWIKGFTTPHQKETLYRKARNYSTLDIVFPKEQKFYRESPQFPPRTSSKSHHVDNSPVSLSEERKEIRKIIKEQDIDAITLRDVRRILGEKLGHTPRMEKKEMKEYVKKLLSKRKKAISLNPLSPKERKEVKEIIKEYDIRVITVRDVQRILRDRLGKSPIMKKRDLRKYVKELLSEPQESVSKSTLTDEKDLPDKLAIRDIAGGNFVVWGKLLPKYSRQLLELGGTHLWKIVGGKLVEDKSIIQFRGKNMEQNLQELKKLGGHLTKTKVPMMIFEGVVVDQNRKKLEELGGKYPKKKVGSQKLRDIYRIKFPDYYRDRVEEFIFETLSDNEKYTVAYQRWAEAKFTDFVDTSIQIANFDDTTKISRGLIEFVIYKIYGCVNIQKKSKQTSGVDFDDIVRKVFSSKKYSKYQLSSNAKKFLIEYVKFLGQTLTTSIGKPTYKNFQEKLEEFGKIVDKMGDCKSIDVFSAQEICILRALYHITSCLMEKFQYPLDINLCVRSFLILLPPTGLREGAEQYIDSIVNSREWKYEDWMPEDEIERHLQSQGIKFSLASLYQIIKYFDARSNYPLCTPSPECNGLEECAIVYATVLRYLSPGLEKIHHGHILRRVKVLGTF